MTEEKRIRNDARPLRAGALTALALALSVAATAPTLAQEADTDGDGVPNVAEPLLGTDPQNADTDGDGLDDLADDKPTFLADPMAAGGPPAPFKIKEVLVENNYDEAARQDAPDHLEIVVDNPTDAALGGFAIYYTITDQDSGAVEAYARKLDGFEVPAKGEARINFDDTGLPGHFRANPSSSYVTSQAGKTFTVALQANGSAPVTAKVMKDPGGAEKAD